MSTHNLCFGAKIRKVGLPQHTSVVPYKSHLSGVQGGTFQRHVMSIYEIHAMRDM